VLKNRGRGRGFGDRADRHRIRDEVHGGATRQIDREVGTRSGDQRMRAEVGIEITGERRVRSCGVAKGLPPVQIFPRSPPIHAGAVGHQPRLLEPDSPESAPACSVSWSPVGGPSACT